MIVGAHALIYSRKPEADRAFLKDVLKLPHVDVGGGWLIFGLPPSEVAVHPADKNDRQDLYLMCEDVEVFVAEMADRKLTCSAVQNQGWGLVTQLTLPGGGRLGVYEPRHARPKQPSARTSERPSAKTKLSGGKARRR
jgi:hypothetical protein